MRPRHRGGAIADRLFKQPRQRHPPVRGAHGGQHDLRPRRCHNRRPAGPARLYDRRVGDRRRDGIMTTSAVIDQNGITVPTYTEVLLDLESQYKTIYGEDAYLAADSEDGQL